MILHPRLLSLLVLVQDVSLGCKLLDSVISQAKIWGFICQYRGANCWQILSQQANQRWKLQQDEDTWILSVGDVPSSSLYEWQP